MTGRITDLIKFVFQYKHFPIKQNLNIHKKDINRFLFTEKHTIYIYWTIYYLLDFYANDLLKIWRTIFFFKMRKVKPCKCSRSWVTLNECGWNRRTFSLQVNCLKCRWSASDLSNGELKFSFSYLMYVIGASNYHEFFCRFLYFLL